MARSRLLRNEIDTARPDAVVPVQRPLRTAATTGLPRSAPGEVRLIGGQWKRSKLPVLARPGLRPTPDRVRETLFNWLGASLAGWRCVDVFAGSGALGFEAASRGAAEVLLLERDAALAQALRAVQARLHAHTVRIETTDALGWMRRHAGAPYDLVLLDPPFDADWHSDALRAARRLVAVDGRVYLEAGRAWDAAEFATLGFGLHRHTRAGQVHAHLLVPLPALTPPTQETPCPSQPD